MDRLTHEGNFCDISKCADDFLCTDDDKKYCTQRKVWERLKAYEDTGLTPAEINTILRQTDDQRKDDTQA